MTLGAGALFLRGVPIDNSVGVWFPRDDPALADYEQSLRAFGESEWTLLMVEAESVFAEPFLRDLQSLTDELGSLQHVDRVLSFLNAPGTDRARGPGAKPEALERRLRGNPFVSDLLLRPLDRRRTVLLIRTDNFIEREDPYRVELVDGIHAAVERCTAIASHSLAGTTVINAELNRTARRDMFVFFSLVVLLLFAISLALFRSLADAGVLLAVALSTVVITLGLILLCGYSLNMVTIMLPTVLIALAVADVIHVIHTFHHHRARGAADDAVGAVLTELWLPCLGTTVTTIVGFLSFAGSSVLPVFQLAIFSSFGIGLAYVLALTVAPLLLHKAWRVRRRAVPAGGVRRPGYIACLIRLVRYRPAAILIGFFVVASSLAGLSRLKADTNYLDFFRSGSPVPEAYARIEARGFPQNPLAIVLEADGERGFPDLLWARVDAFAAKLRRMDDVSAVLSPTGLPAAGPASGSGEGLGLVSDDGRRCQLVLMTPFMSSSDLGRLTDRVRRMAGEILPEVRVVVTGTTVLWASMDTGVIRTQVSSVLIVSVAMLIILCVIFRSPRLALLGWFVSLFPVAAILGLMGILGVHIDMATVLIAGIALGIAVDDTIHFVFAYGDARRAGAGARPAVNQALTRVGPRMLLTSLILVGAFSTMALSDFLPTAHFGIFSCLTILLALGMDLTMLPLALRGRGRFGRRGSRAPVADVTTRTAISQSS
ncbi:MAG: MMPL family transporter [Planctomycetota bacterium]|nr:MMPL family transporter [Planctomycetota bacterium]